MKSFALSYGAALVAFLALDSVWITIMGGALYRPVMGDMLLEGFRPLPALLFYLIYLGGLVHFGVSPGERRTFASVLVNAALFGFVAYATYDLTNQATLKNWSTTLTVADLIWGTFVSTVGAGAGKLALRALNR